MAQTFRPPWWLAHAHFQTLWPTLARRTKSARFYRERLELPDGDFLDLDWTRSASERAGAPTVIVFHGLEGSIHSPYAHGMMSAIHRCGWNGVLMHFRGCSGSANRTDRRYHSGETEDAAYVLSYLQRCGIEQIGAVGFSLGGNMLLKWLGETGPSNPLSSAVAISVPYDLSRAAQRLETGFSRFYQWWLMRSMRRSVLRQFANRDDPPIDLSKVAATRTFREFDNAVTAPLHGFRDADHYYEHCSARRYVRDIAVPTLLIQAADDPFMFSDVIPLPCELPACVQLDNPAHGGHVGFVQGTVPWRLQYWHETRVCEHIAKQWPN
ncbi:MAG: putative alpha/beta-fold hydrolase [Gammaproteobacteria bacterium]|jgi:predicted alpha/beta-fold hydrolase